MLVVHQGHVWREVTVRMPSASAVARAELLDVAAKRLSAGKPALVPLDVTVWPAFPRSEGGERQLASIAAGGLSVHLVDGPTANVLVVTKGSRGGRFAGSSCRRGTAHLT